jgi:hypothetical protein
MASSVSVNCQFTKANPKFHQTSDREDARSGNLAGLRIPRDAEGAFVAPPRLTLPAGRRQIRWDPNSVREVVRRVQEGPAAARDDVVPPLLDMPGVVVAVVDDRHQVEAGAADPVAERPAVDLDSLPPEDRKRRLGRLTGADADGLIHSPPDAGDGVAAGRAPGQARAAGG